MDRKKLPKQRRSHRYQIAARIAIASVLAPASAGLATPTIVTNNSTTFVANNGPLSFTYSKSGAKITSITYDGQQMVGSKGLYYDVQGTPWIYLNSTATFATRSGANFLDITAKHSWTTAEPLDITWHWILKDNEPGFHTYMEYHHSAAMPDWPSSENRYAEFFNESLFDYSSITDKYWGYQAAGDPLRGQGRYVTAETSDMKGLPSEITKSYETKYDWRTTYAESEGVTGLFTSPNTSAATKANVTNNYGVWNVISQRNFESWNAGPTHPQAPWADGASFIVTPAASHQGGPGSTYSGDEDKFFAPQFTYFNKTSGSVQDLRNDAKTKIAGLDSFYDSLGLNGYSTAAQRGSVTGKVRMADGTSMAGSTVILSTFNSAAYAIDPIGQEYQRRADGYNYWATPNADGTYSIPDVRPGTYRVTIIKPGNYREATFDTITVAAGANTSAGNMTYVPDVGGKGVFQVGKFDRRSGEFKRGDEFNNWIDTFDYDKDFPSGVNYTVNPANPLNDTTNWRNNWGLDQINGTQDGWKINFNLASAPAAGSTAVITMGIVGQNFINRINVNVNGTTSVTNFDHTLDNSSIVFRSGDTGSRILYRKLVVSGLKAGANTITFDIGAGGTGQEMQWDAIRMDILNPGTFSTSQWNGASGNWSDGAQWKTQAYNYTGIQKGTGAILESTSTTFADGSTATAPVNNTGTQKYYDAIINGGTITLDTSPTIQKLSLLEGTISSATPRTITANDDVVLGGGTISGPITLAAPTNTYVGFTNTITGGAKVNSTGNVNWYDGAVMNINGSGSQWNVTSNLNYGSPGATGTINVGAGSTLSTNVNSSSITIGSQGTLINAGQVSALALTNSGTINSTGTITIGGALTNSGNATIGTLNAHDVANTGGLLVLSGNNSYGFGTSITGGAVQFGNANSFGSAGVNVTVGPGGAGAYSGGVIDATFISHISTGSAGALALTAADAATNIDFSQPSLSPLGNMAIGAVGNVTYTGLYTPLNSIYRLGGGGGTLNYSPTISGTSQVRIGNTGSSGTVVLNDANSYTGVTTIKGGTLSVNTIANGGLASGIGMTSNLPGNLVIDGGTLKYTGIATSTDRLLTVGSNGATIDASGTGAITFTSTSQISQVSGTSRTITFTGNSTASNTFACGISDALGGTTSITKDGTGTWVLGAGFHTYSGDTTVLGGILKLAAGFTFPTASPKGNVAVGINGTLDIAGVGSAINALSDGPASGVASEFNPSAWATPNGPGGGIVTNTGALVNLTVGTYDNSGQFSGVISGAINLIKSGTGTQILSGDNTYTGTTTISAGTLQIGVGGTPKSTGEGDGGFRGKLGAGAVTNNATLVFNRGYYTTCSNIIGGTGTLKQISNAVLVLGSSNTYTGSTVIGGGIANVGLGGASDPTDLAHTGSCFINASVIANGGVASSIGASSNAAANLVLDGGGLFYSSTTARTTDRLMTITQNGGQIYTRGALTFSNGGPIVLSGSGDRTLILAGDSSSASTWGNDIGDPASGKMSITKDRSAAWTISNTAALTYSGDTKILMGTLQLTGSGASLPFGVGKGNLVFNTSTDFSSVYDAKFNLNGISTNINGLSGGRSDYCNVNNSGAAANLTLGNGDATATYNGLIINNIKLIKTGLGTQTLSQFNTYSGGTTVNQGVLLATAPACLPLSAINATTTTGSNAVVLTAAIGRLVVGQPVSGAGIPAGATIASITDSTHFTISANATATSATTSLTFAAGTSFSATPALTLNYPGIAAVPASLTQGYTLADWVIKVTAASTGVLAINGPDNSSPNFTAVPGLYLGAYGSQTFSGTITPGSAGYRLGGSGTLTIPNTNELTGNSNLNITGGGTVVLSAAQNFTGNTIINNNGDLWTSIANALPYGLGNGNVQIDSGRLYLNNGNQNINALTGAGGTVGAPAARTLTIGNGNASGSYAGAITNAISLIKTGIGTQTFTGASSYTGTTTIQPGGAIEVAVLANGGTASGIGQSSNAATNLIIDGATLRYIGSTTGTTDRLFTMTANGATIESAGTAGVTFSSSGSITQSGSGNRSLTLGGTHVNAGSDDTFNPQISDPGGGVTSLVKNGTGRWTIGGVTKTYSGDTTINAGQLYIGTTNILPSGTGKGNVVINGGSLVLSGGNLSINGLNGAAGSTVDAPAARTLTIGSNNTSASFAGDIVNAISLVKTGSGTQTLSGNNSHAGTTTVNGGRLLLTRGLQNAQPISITNNAIVEISPNGLSQGVTKISSLSMASDLSGGYNADLDLHDNDLVIDYGLGASPYAATINMVKKGLTLLDGNGKGIGSTEVDTQTLMGTVLAVVDDGAISGGITSLSGFSSFSQNSILVKYTWFGDSNLDGLVDGSDFALIDTGFTSGGILNGWFYGDYNYNGIVETSDYALIDTGFISQMGALPEPSMLGLIGLGAINLLRRNRVR